MYQPEERDDDNEDVKGAMVRRVVSVELSPDEERDLGRKAAELNREINEVEEEFHGMREAYRSKISLKEAERDRLLRLLDEGHEEREVECEERKDFKRGEVEWLYQGRLVGKRPMSNAERQLTLA